MIKNNKNIDPFAQKGIKQIVPKLDEKKDVPSENESQCEFVVKKVPFSILYKKERFFDYTKFQEKLKEDFDIFAIDRESFAIKQWITKSEEKSAECLKIYLNNQDPDNLLGLINSIFVDKYYESIDDFLKNIKSDESKKDNYKSLLYWQIEHDMQNLSLIDSCCKYIAYLEENDYPKFQNYLYKKNKQLLDTLVAESNPKNDSKKEEWHFKFFVSYLSNVELFSSYKDDDKEQIFYKFFFPNNSLLPTDVNSIEKFLLIWKKYLEYKQIPNEDSMSYYLVLKCIHEEMNKATGVLSKPFGEQYFLEIKHKAICFDERPINKLSDYKVRNLSNLQKIHGDLQKILEPPKYEGAKKKINDQLSPSMPFFLYENDVNDELVYVFKIYSKKELPKELRREYKNLIENYKFSQEVSSIIEEPSLDCIINNVREIFEDLTNCGLFNWGVNWITLDTYQNLKKKWKDYEKLENVVLNTNDFFRYEKWLILNYFAIVAKITESFSDDKIQELEKKYSIPDKFKVYLKNKIQSPNPEHVINVLLLKFDIYE